MSDTPATSIFARRTRSRRKPRTLDPADMGTAFGMEYSLDQQRVSAEHAKPPSNASSGWLPRWLKGGARG